MPLRNYSGVLPGKGIEVNGDLVSYTVSDGYYVSVGDFVVSVDSTTVRPYLYASGTEQRILGVARTRGNPGDTIRVYVPVI